MATELANDILESSHASYTAKSLCKPLCRCWSDMATTSSQSAFMATSTSESSGNPTAPSSGTKYASSTATAAHSAQAARGAHLHHAVQRSESDEARVHEDADWGAPNVRPPNACRLARYKDSATGSSSKLGCIRWRITLS